MSSESVPHRMKVSILGGSRVLEVIQYTVGAWMYASGYCPVTLLCIRAGSQLSGVRKVKGNENGHSTGMGRGRVDARGPWIVGRCPSFDFKLARACSVPEPTNERTPHTHPNGVRNNKKTKPPRSRPKGSKNGPNAGKNGRPRWKAQKGCADIQVGAGARLLYELCPMLTVIRHDPSTAGGITSRSVSGLLLLMWKTRTHVAP
jgi:hypothetical protein